VPCLGVGYRDRACAAFRPLATPGSWFPVGNGTCGSADDLGVRDFKVKPVPVWYPSNPRIFR